MIDFFHKGAEMTKKVTGVAKMKGAPVVNSRPARKISKIAEFMDEEDVVTRVLLEVASTPDERRRGLMGRESLPSVCGMLFEGLSGGGYFWMKDCLIPLDVVFMNKGGAITRIYTMPVDKAGTKHYDYDEDDASAIELQEGFCKKHGIVRGLMVDISDISGKDKNGK